MTAKTSTSLSTADFGTRFSAFVIDGALLFAVQWVIFIALSRQLQAVGMTSSEACDETTAAICEGPSTLLWALLLVFLLVSTIGYHALFEGRYGATPGKRWMGLAVVDADRRSPIGLTAGLLRSVFRQSFWLSLFFVLDASPLSLGLPSLLFIALPLLTLTVFVIGAVNPSGQAGHDLIARTYVVRTDQVDVKPAVQAQPATAASSQTPTTIDVETSEESV